VGQVATKLGQSSVMAAAHSDALRIRERNRRRRLVWVSLVLGGPTAFLWYRILDHRPFNPFALPTLPEDWAFYAPMFLIGLVIVAAILIPMLGAGRSPHLMFRPEQIDVTMDDVKGLESVREEVIRTMNVFLGYATFRRELGGNPRRGVLFEGPPGTGKTHMAKAMAKHAGVPFLFVAGPAFQSMFYGQTARKIRSYFKALKKTARAEGGAIGFIEEIDAFATKRGGMAASTASASEAAMAGGRVTNAAVAEGTGGVVNELLIQMQSFDDPPPGAVFLNKVKDLVNRFLPMHRQLKKKGADYANVLVIAATNRGDMLDPALLRPGRFDRRLHFDLPSRQGRRDLIDYFLSKKRHDESLAGDQVRDDLAGMTFGYSPVMIEHLFDEALILALRGGRDAMAWQDVTGAKLSTEVGLPNDAVIYTADERRQIATHEAGHATAAYLVGAGRKMEILSIIKRKDALGLLGHSDAEERFTKTRSEMQALLKISLAGMASEEIFEGESGTGPAGDLAHATAIAAEMIGSLGLGESLVSYRAMGESVLDPGLVGRVLGNAGAKKEVDALLRAQKEDVRALLDANQHLVLALRDALLDRDELIGHEIVEVLEAAGKPAKPRQRKRSARGAASRAASTGRS